MKSVLRETEICPQNSLRHRVVLMSVILFEPDVWFWKH